MFGIVTKLSKLFEQENTQRAHDEEDNRVIFLGKEDKPTGNSFEFWFSFTDSPDILLPGYATDEEVIGKLKNMDIGQVFRVVEEEDVGPLGVELLKIETREDDPIIDVMHNNTPSVNNSRDALRCG